MTFVLSPVLPEDFRTKEAAIAEIKRRGFTRHVGTGESGDDGHGSREYFDLPFSVGERHRATASKVGLVWRVAIFADEPEVRQARAEILARMIAEEAKASLPPTDWADVEAGVSQLDDVCDGNVLIATAFAKMLGGPLPTEQRMAREEASGQDEVLTLAQQYAEEDESRIWNAAVALFVSRLGAEEAYQDDQPQEGVPPRPKRDKEAILAKCQTAAERVMVAALIEAESALYEGMWNCGFEKDCLWAAPYQLAGAALDAMAL